MIRPLPQSLDRDEALRYLGGAGKEVPPAVDALLDRAAVELWRTAAPRAAVRRLPADRLTPLLAGRDIAAHLQGCDEGLLLAVTLGAGAVSYTHLDVYKRQSSPRPRRLSSTKALSAPAWVRYSRPRLPPKRAASTGTTTPTAKKPSAAIRPSSQW